MNGAFLSFLYERTPELCEKTIEHLFLTGISTIFATLIGVPLGIWVVRNARIRGWILGSVGILQTIPSLALLAFLLPLLGIGVAPALVALTMYALLPIVRNTYTGIQGLPDDILEAADGLGFTKRQRLLWIELPLAFPVILAGIRTASVIGVGIATLSAFIGAGGLGDFIVRGLAQTNNQLILLGAVPSALLALILDSALGYLEKLADRKNRRASGWIKSILIPAVFIAAIAGFFALYLAQNTDFYRTDRTPIVRIGTKNFTEQFILGEIVARTLENQTELQVERRFNLGGTMICHQALTAGEIDLYPEYTGTALLSILNEGKNSNPSDVYDIVQKAYREQFDCVWLKPFGFNNTYAITVRENDANSRQWRTISDLASLAKTLRAGFTAEFYERPDGYPGMKEAYGLSFGEVRELDPGLMYGAISQGEVDVIGAFATDGRIAANKLVTLKDDRSFFPPYYAAPVIRSEILERRPAIQIALDNLADTLDDETMRRLNYQVDVENRSVASVVEEFLGIP